MESQSHAADAAPAELERPFPTGYRFIPTEEELITEYLKKKVNGKPILVENKVVVQKMHDVKLLDHSPMHLTANYAPLGEKQWYFFTPRDRKYPKGTRPNRSVKSGGFWKATAGDKEIQSSTGDGECIGKKQVLVFYKGKPKSSEEEKTNWIMHEYRLNSNGDMKLDDWVLCKIYEASKRSRKIPVAHLPLVAPVEGNVIVGSSYDVTLSENNRNQNS